MCTDCGDVHTTFKGHRIFSEKNYKKREKAGVIHIFINIVDISVNFVHCPDFRPE
jgi:hypothetical protein